MRPLCIVHNTYLLHIVYYFDLTARGAAITLQCLTGTRHYLALLMAPYARPLVAK